MAAIVTRPGMPEWTQVHQKGGLDPLGMQASSVRLYQRLVPGISNVTLRMRYYGLYAWLTKHYAEKQHDADPVKWKQTVRRAEALYALIAARAGEKDSAETGVAGVFWAQRKLEGRGKSNMVDFSSDADPGGEGKPYLKQAWGAFGAAYESQLREMGVLAVADEHEISVPSSAVGDPLAEAFAKSAGDAGARFLKAAAAGRASLASLDAMTDMLPSAIGASSTERRLYDKMLFAESTGASENDLARRQTLTLVLRAARQLEREPHANDVRWMLYAGVDWDGQKFTQEEPQLVAQTSRWWAYHASDLWRISYEALLKWTLDILEIHPEGLSGHQLAALAVEQLEVKGANWPASWSLLCSSLPLAANALSESDATADYKLAEEVLQAGTGQQKAPLRSAQAAVELLAVLFRQCHPQKELLSKELGGHDLDAPSRSIANELQFFEVGAGLPLPALLRSLIKDRIVDRHLWIAMRKLQFQRDYTFLIDVNDGRMFLRAKDGPVFTNPRLGPAIAFLRDTNLLTENGPTKKGDARASAS